MAHWNSGPPPTLLGRRTFRLGPPLLDREAGGPAVPDRWMSQDSKSADHSRPGPGPTGLPGREARWIVLTDKPWFGAHAARSDAAVTAVFGAARGAFRRQAPAGADAGMIQRPHWKLAGIRAAIRARQQSRALFQYAAHVELAFHRPHRASTTKGINKQFHSARLEIKPASEARPAQARPRDKVAPSERRGQPAQERRLRHGWRKCKAGEHRRRAAHG